MYFVSCFLAMILLAVTLEQIDWRGPFLQVAYMLGIIVTALLVCFASLRQYSFLLTRAECFGSQSSCAACGAYGVLLVLAAGASNVASSTLTRRPDNAWVRVRCKKCGHEWRIDND